MVPDDKHGWRVIVANRGQRLLTADHKRRLAELQRRLRLLFELQPELPLTAGLLDSITSRLVVGGLLELVWIYVDTSEPVRKHLNVFTSPSRAHCVYGAESETELAEACRPLSALLPAIDPGNVIRRARYFA